MSIIQMCKLNQYVVKCSKIFEDWDVSIKNLLALKDFRKRFLDFPPWSSQPMLHPSPRRCARSACTPTTRPSLVASIGSRVDILKPFWPWYLSLQAAAPTAPGVTSCTTSPRLARLPASWRLQRFHISPRTFDSRGPQTVVLNPGDSGFVSPNTSPPPPALYKVAALSSATSKSPSTSPSTSPTTLLLPPQPSVPLGTKLAPPPSLDCLHRYVLLGVLGGSLTGPSN